MVIAIPASAIKVHVFKETFGSAAQPSFGAQGIAIDQSTGDVLVMDVAASTISRYNADGTAANFSALGTNAIDGKGSGDETPQNGLSFAGPYASQIAVDNSGTATDGNIYVTQGSPNAVDVFSKTGTYLGQLTAAGATNFSEACGVAVDPSGAVYVGDYSAGIHKFVPAANPPVNTDNTATFTTTTNPCALAAGAGPTAGFLFAAQYGGPISKLDSSTGELKYTVSPGSHVTITVNPGNGYVYGAPGNSTIEVFDASGAGSATSIPSFESEGSVQGLAVNSTSGNVYVSHSAAANLEVFSDLTTFPDAANDAPTNLTGTSATLNGTVNPDGVALTECKFEYGTSTAYGQTVPCVESPGAIGSGSSPVPVHADIGGLTVSTVYHFRLVAANANGSLPGSDATFQTLGPVIKDVGVTNVVLTDAIVRATVNPGGSPTTIRVEYGTDTSYGQSTTEIGVGSGSTDHIVNVALEGLEPATTYHWRLVATNADGTVSSLDRAFMTHATALPDTSCPNQAFRYGAGGNLPDCRAYEMVSPVDKNGGEIRSLCSFECFRTSVNQSSLDGNKVTYSSLTAFGDAVSAPHVNQYISTRGANGWSTHGVSPRRTSTALTGFTGYDYRYDLDAEFKAFTPDLSRALVINDDRSPLTADAVNGFANLYWRDNLGESYEALTTFEPTSYEFKNLELSVLGLSGDGEHVLISAMANLTPDAVATENQQLYEYSGGELHLVSVLPNGAPNTAASAAGTNRSNFTYEDSTHGWLALDHVISNDGSRIFWTPASASSNYGPIYVRKNAAEEPSALNGSNECTEPSKACTAVVSADPQSLFWSASVDGSKVLFTTGQVSEDVGKIPAQLSLFDVDAETTTPIAGEVRGVSGVSNDLSRIYFVSLEALDAGATDGERNLYLYDEGTVTFIATLSDRDTGIFPLEGPGATHRQPAYRSTKVTPDGRHFAFMSTRSLTGYDNTDAVNGKTDFEVFIYGADTQQLTCASCNPSQARPVGNYYVWPNTQGGSGFIDYFQDTDNWVAAWLTTAPNSQYEPNALSDDGSRLFFNSYDALVPQDTNGQQDVYQWKAQGAGGCQKPEGCIDLLSTGHSPLKSEFVDASADGRDVFIETASSIDPRDTYGIDIYDVRVGGGYQPPPAAPLPCTGDACQNIPAAPNDQTPASAAFKGAGDPAPRKSHRNNCRKASKGKSQAKKHKKAKRCRSTKRRAGR
jgi:hypothetical protein